MAMVLLAAAVVFLVAFGALRVCVGTFSVLTLHTVWYATHIVLTGIGTFVIVAEHGLNPATYTYLISVTLAALLFPIGGIAANMVTRFKPRTELLSYFSQPLQATRMLSTGSLSYLVVTVLAITITAAYWLRVQASPFVALISSRGNEILSSMRASATYFFPHYYRYQIVIATVLPFISIYSLVRYMKNRRPMWGFTFIALFLYMLFVFQFPGNRGFYITPVLFLGVAVHLGRRKQLRARHYALAFIFLLLVLTMYFALKINTPLTPSHLLRPMALAVRRLTITNANTLYYRYHLFPSIHPFLQGSAFPDAGGKYVLARLLGRSGFSLKAYVAEFIYPMVSYPVTAPSVFYGDVYANFGLIAALTSVFTMGFLLQCIQVYWVRRGKSVLSVSLYPLLVYYAAVVSQSGLWTTFLTTGLLTVVVLGFGFSATEIVCGGIAKEHFACRAGRG